MSAAVAIYQHVAQTLVVLVVPILPAGPVKTL